MQDFAFSRVGDEPPVAVVKYEVMRRENFEELVAAVNSYLNNGWQLVGGVSVMTHVTHYQNRDDVLCSDVVTVCAQALVKRS